MELTNIEAALLVLSLLLPGFITVSLFRFIVPAKELSDQRGILSYLGVQHHQLCIFRLATLARVRMGRSGTKHLSCCPCLAFCLFRWAGRARPSVRVCLAAEHSSAHGRRNRDSHSAPHSQFMGLHVRFRGRTQLDARHPNRREPSGRLFWKAFVCIFRPE